METVVLDQAAAKDAAAKLVELSPLHRRWSNAAIRCAIHTDQYLILYEGAEPVAFLSWAWLSPRKAEQYIADVHKFSAVDFLPTCPDDQLWIIDLIAPHGHVMEIARVAQEILGPMARDRGIDGARMIRQRKPRRIGFFSAAERTRQV